MKPKYAHLLSPLKVRSFVLKNRMMSANSLPHFLQGPEPYPADGPITHYNNRAKSGAAIVSVTHFTSVPREKKFPSFLDFSHMPAFDLYEARCQNYLLHLADVIHYHHSVASACLFIGPPSNYLLQKKAGPEVVQGNVNGDTGDPTKPFDVPKEERYEFEEIPAHNLPHEYDEEALDKIAESYAQQCGILRGLGFEMVNIHMSYRGNLPAKFFSPITNFRTDGWGGSVENRMRFPLMVLQRVRERVGPNTIIEIQWSTQELEGGYSKEDTVAFLNEAKRYVDIVELRGPEGDASHPTGFNLNPYPFLEDAAYVKAHVPGILVATIGGYQEPDVMEEAIAQGKADIISMARAWISNPDYGELVAQGRGEDLVPCLRCNKCHGRGPDDPFVSVCSVNPILGLEHRLGDMVSPVTRHKRVAVIGGGPAGLRCAIYLADRGHEVTVYEAGPALGGAIRHADFVSFKWPLRNFKSYLIRQVEKRDRITVRLNTPVTPAQVEAEQFDAVVAALGAAPALPPIPGLEPGSFLFATEALEHTDRLGRNVVIIGGGEVGVETGMHAAQQGRKATVLEMRDMLAADSTKIHYRSMFREAWEAEPNFTGIVNARVTAVDADGVRYVDPEGAEHVVPADTVVVSAGMKAKTDEALAFYGTAPEFYMTGDCERAATVQQAMRSAFAVAHKI